MAWVSSMMLCVGAVLAGVAAGMNEKDILAGILYASLCAVAYLVVWAVLELFGVGNHDFVIKTIFKYSIFGLLSILFIGMGSTLLVLNLKERKNPWQFWYGILGSLVIVIVGIILSGAFEIVPLSNAAITLLGNIMLSALGGLVLIFLAALCCGKLKCL